MKRLVCPLVLLVSLLLTACQSPPFKCDDALGCVTVAPDEALKFGVIQDMSGGGAIFGVEQAHIFELAVAERDGKLLGHPIEFQVEDEGCTPEGGGNAALRVVADPQVVGVFGTTCSSAAAEAGGIISNTGLVMISGVNSTPALTSIAGQPGKDWHSGYFRTMINIVEEARVSAVFVLEELDLSKAATINDGDAFSQEYASVFEQVFTEKGGEIVLTAVVNKGDTNMRPLLTSVANSGADVVFLALFPPEGASIVKQSKEIAELEDLVIFGGGSLRTADFIEGVGDDGIGVYFIGSAPPPEGPKHDELVTSYEAYFGQALQTVPYGHGYDAVNMLFHAVEKVAVQEKDGTLHIGRQSLRHALYATQDFEGITGNITCDRFGDCAVVKFDLVRLDDPAAGVDGLLSNVIYAYGP